MRIVLDLDRTLNLLRPHWIRSVRELAPLELQRENGRALWDWLATHLSDVDYAVNQDAIEVFRSLREAASMVIVNTGRPEAARAATEAWLRNHFTVDRVYMRDAGDYRPTAEIKRRNLKCAGLEGQREAIFAIEDNQAALRMYQEAGVAPIAAPACWQRLGRLMRRASAIDALAACVWSGVTLSATSGLLRQTDRPTDQ